MFRPRWVTAFIAIAAVFVLMTADAHARAGGGFSGGSRGMRTFSAPPSTPTAPTAAPIQNSMTQPGGAASIGQAGARPGLFGGRGFSAADYSAELLPASSVRVCLVCCSDKDFSVAWRASPRSSVCSSKSCWW